MHLPYTLPGFANTHSHGYHRALRGLVQRRDPKHADTLSTWRERVYELSSAIDLDSLEEAVRGCYVECIETGYTAVGEFHYLHHGPRGAPWSDPTAAARTYLRAAEQTGIRLALIWTVYARDGFDEPLTPKQPRYAVPSSHAVWRAVDKLMGDVDGDRTRMALGIHSVRTVPRDWLGPLAEGARERRLPIHVNLSQERGEVDACRASTGLSPVALLAAEGVLGPDCTAVHATAVDANDMDLLAKHGATVCICPTTECDLGVGIPPTAELYARRIPLALGSGSHALIDPFCETRMIEYLARASTETRCVLIDDRGRITHPLLEIAHDNGYRALGLDDTGDRVYLDPEARALKQCSAPLEAVLTSGHPALVDAVEVGGERLVEGGRHLYVF